MKIAHNGELRPSARLSSLEAGRGIAAILVTMFHLGGICLEGCRSYPLLSVPFRAGHAGVEYFFALSGFIIYISHIGDVGKSGKFGGFLAKRIIRIAPMYWITITIIFVLLVAAHPGIIAKSDIWAIISNYLLIPSNAPLILQPAWTLKREVLFYAVFSASIFAPRFGIFLFLSWQLIIIFANIYWACYDIYPAEMIWYLFGVHNFGFFVGVCCAVAVSHCTLPSRSFYIPIAVGCFGAAVTMIAEVFASLTPQPTQGSFREIVQSSSYALSFGLLIYGFVALERTSELRPSRILSILGASSYVIYLLHEPVQSVVMKIFAILFGYNVISPDLAYIVAVLVVIVVSLFCHYTIEVPITRRLRSVSGVSSRRVP